MGDGGFEWRWGDGELLTSAIVAVLRVGLKPKRTTWTIGIVYVSREYSFFFRHRFLFGKGVGCEDGDVVIVFYTVGGLGVMVNI